LIRQITAFFDSNSEWRQLAGEGVAREELCFMFLALFINCKVYGNFRVMCEPDLSSEK